MNRLVLIAVLVFSASGMVFEPSAGLEDEVYKKAVQPHELPGKKWDDEPGAPDPTMDGVVTGKGKELSKNADPVMIYTIYIRTNKGKLRKFRTTESNYSMLEKGYSVHYVLTGSGRYKLVQFKAPE